MGWHITQSSMIDSAEASSDRMSDFAARLEREAKRRGAFHRDEVVILSDGAKWIENATRKVFAGMKLTSVLDLFHVLEKLQNALKDLIPDDAKRKATFDRIKAGNAALVVEELAPHGSQCAAVGDFVRYCRANLYRMRYNEYRRRGLPCGSGIIEGGCRTVVVDRLNKERQPLVAGRRKRDYGYPMLPNEQPRRRLLLMAHRSLIQQIWAAPVVGT